jgi:Ca-activated chloride channel family protein
MSLSWPWALTALLAFPLLLGYRWWMQRRRRRQAIRLSSVTLVRAALPSQSRWRRRIPLWLFAGGLIVLGTGAARPQASVLVPSDASSILLVIDVSASMCSTDVPPNRLMAAQEAARTFIEAQRSGTQIGLVAFSGLASLLVPPTTDKQQLYAALGSLRTGRGTAIGLGILAAVDAIADINPNVVPSGIELRPDPNGPGKDFEPDTIILLTDGANTQGVSPATAAEQAAARHLRVYTIGFGTTQPAPSVCTPNQIGSPAPPNSRDLSGAAGGFGGYGGGTGRNQDIDEDALTEVANITGGKYFQATDAQALTSTLLDLPKSIVLQRKDIELSVWFALAGFVFVLTALGLTQWWQRAATTPPS